MVLDAMVFSPFSGTIELLHPSTTMLPCSLYRVPIRTPRINISASRTILQVSFLNTVFTPASSNLLTKIRFLANAGICRTPGSVLTLPPVVMKTQPPPLLTCSTKIMGTLSIKFWLNTFLDFYLFLDPILGWANLPMVFGSWFWTRWFFGPWYWMLRHV